MDSIAKSEQHILLVPVGGISGMVLERVSNDLYACHAWKCSIAPGLSIPPYAYDARRQQYSSSVFLNLLHERYPPKDTVPLGVIDCDLFVPQLSFVFGEADAANGYAVISLTRLREEFYGLPPDEDLFYRRVLTEATHEIGHALRLPHCVNKTCVMYFSSTLHDTDTKGYTFCESCALAVRCRA